MRRFEMGEYLPCPDCGSLGYTDQRLRTKRGYLCVRCARPDINWAQWDNVEVVKDSR